MSKIDLSSAAAVAEIIASVAVVISLIFVVVSLNQNTEALRSSNDNYLYELTDSQFSDLQSDPDLARIILKSVSGEALIPDEALRFEVAIVRLLNTWELAFSRYQDGLMDPSDWSSWNVSFVSIIFPIFPKEKWSDSKVGYTEDFVKHVDAMYARE